MVAGARESAMCACVFSREHAYAHTKQIIQNKVYYTNTCTSTLTDGPFSCAAGYHRRNGDFGGALEMRPTISIHHFQHEEAQIRRLGQTKFRSPLSICVRSSLSGGRADESTPSLEMRNGHEIVEED